MKRRELRNKTVVLTGASSGIGRATALAFAERGARLVLAARDAAPLERIAKECSDVYGTVAMAVPTDIRDEASVDGLADLAADRFGQVDVWVNDAAVYMMGPLEATPTAAIRELLETNFMGTVYGTRAALRLFRSRNTGVLVNVGSLAGKVSYGESAPYCAAKHAVHGLTEALRQELRGTDIHACLCVPGTVDTPLFQHAANFSGREILAMRPIYRASRVAEAIVGLAERPRREAVVGAAPRLMTLFDHVAPWLYERVARALVLREHLGEGLAPTDGGNLAVPRGPHAIEGGWKARRSAVTRLAPRTVP